jgi:hypothetical protein
MSRKKNNRTLFIVFGVLLAAFLVMEGVKLTRGERTFRDDIIAYEADQISKITFNTKGPAAVPVELYKVDTTWKLTAGGKEYAADQEMANGIAGELALITPERLVANKKDLWKDYDVTDSAGTRLTIYGPKKSKTELVIGRFSYNQSTRQPVTYVRIENENEVFAVEGYLAMTFGRDINGLRDKNLFKGNQNDITRISFSYPADSSYELTRDGLKWMVAGIPADSMKAVRFMNEVTYLVGADFRDDFQPANAGPELYRMKIEGINIKPVDIVVYQDATGQIVHSSENPTSYFSSQRDNLVQRIFKGKGFFLPK